MTFSAIYILNHKGKVLIYRHYRGDSSTNEIDHFLPTLQYAEDEEISAPVLNFNDEKLNFAFIKCNDLFIVITTKKNSNITIIFVFLNKLVSLMEEYFSIITEESIIDNFIILYELLDEIIDFGYPQITDSQILKQYIWEKSHKLNKTVSIPMSVTNAISWRPEGIKYNKNEVFLDVVESLNIIMNSNGNILRSEVSGVIKMKVKLSGMPQLRLGINDKVLIGAEDDEDLKNSSICLNDMKFHQCVQLSRFTKDKSINFIPPDGDFELMTYRMDFKIRPLFLIDCVIEKFVRSRVEYIIIVRSQFKRSSIAYNVELKIPISAEADSPVLNVTHGEAKYVSEVNSFIWHMKSFSGGHEYRLNAKMKLSSIEGEELEKKNPIKISFNLPYFTISGLHIRYLKIIEKTGYKSLSWVRYLTQNGDFQVRFNY